MQNDSNGSNGDTEVGGEDMTDSEQSQVKIVLMIMAQTVTITLTIMTKLTQIIKLKMTHLKMMMRQQMRTTQIIKIKMAI